MSYKIIFKTPLSGNHLTGYFGSNILSSDGKTLCCLEIPFINKMPNILSGKDVATVKLFNIENNNFTKLTETLVWNFQMGCRLEFINSSNDLIYLALQGSKIVTKIIDVNGNSIDCFNEPFYAFSEHLNSFIGINQDRYSHFRSTYSYPLSDLKRYNNYEENDFIFYYNITTRKKEILFTMKDLFPFPTPVPYFNCVNYLEHLIFSPCGTKFIFVHRFVTPQKQLYSRLFLYDFINSKLELLHSNGRITHFNWIDNNRIIAWQGGDTIAQTFKNKMVSFPFVGNIMKLYKYFIRSNSEVGMNKVSRFVSGDSFAIIDISNGNIDKHSCANLMHDGHPVKLTDNIIICDTYPHGPNNSIDVFTYDLITAERKDVVTVPHPKSLNMTGFRCDAHPKCSKSGKIAIDVIRNNKRSVEVYEKI